MFLASGRHPVFMNKLEFDGNWSNRPRDIANLARFASRELERPVNWQVVNLENGWEDWMDCPVLYLASHKPPALLDADYENLRHFVHEAGSGLLFTTATVTLRRLSINGWPDGACARRVCAGRAATGALP